MAPDPERRKRDLNPRAGSPDLLPFQGSPFGQLGYFSRQIPTNVSSDIYYFNDLIQYEN